MSRLFPDSPPSLSLLALPALSPSSARLLVATVTDTAITQSLHDPEVYPDPEAFKPERFMPGGVNANGTDSKNWLVFGAGAHKCIGQSYVYHQMSAVIGTAAGMMDWEHEVTEESEEIKIIGAPSSRPSCSFLASGGFLALTYVSILPATIFPKDECRLKFTPRGGDH